MYMCVVIYGERTEGRLSKLSGNLSKYRIPEMIHGPGGAPEMLKFSRERAAAAANATARTHCCFIVRVDRDFCQHTII